MAKKRILYARLPDGSEAKRETARDYRFVVARCWDLKIVADKQATARVLRLAVTPEDTERHAAAHALVADKPARGVIQWLDSDLVKEAYRELANGPVRVAARAAAVALHWERHAGKWDAEHWCSRLDLARVAAAQVEKSWPGCRVEIVGVLP